MQRGSPNTPGMNRIAEWRNRRDLTQAQLAELVSKRTGAHTAQSTIQRLETGKTDLTLEWIMLLANILEVSPLDLLGIAVIAQLQNEVEAQRLSLDPSIATALAHKGLLAYTVTSGSLANLGFRPGMSVVVDTSDEAKRDLQTGAVVIAEVATRGEPVHKGLVMRQFMSPALLTTNKPGRNASFSLDDADLDVKIVGIVLPPS
jgi:transcriptional regulator with XRE-family HTH domain